MSLYDRAAQFAPYAALSGYDDMVVEEARLTESEIELSESEIAILNGTLSEIQTLMDNGARPMVSVTYFKPDPYKAGGSYETLTAVPKKIDALEKMMVFYGSEDTQNRQIPTVRVPIERLIEIRILPDK